MCLNVSWAIRIEFRFTSWWCVGYQTGNCVTAPLLTMPLLIGRDYQFTEWYLKSWRVQNTRILYSPSPCLYWHNSHPLLLLDTRYHRYNKKGLVNCETHRTMKFWRLEMFLMIFCGLFSKLTKGLVFLRIWQHDLETVQPHYTFRSRIVYLTWESLIGIYTTYAIYIIWLMLRSVHIDSCALMNNVIGVWFGGLDINCHLCSA